MLSDCGQVLTSHGRSLDFPPGYGQAPYQRETRLVCIDDGETVVGFWAMAVSVDLKLCQCLEDVLKSNVRTRDEGW